MARRPSSMIRTGSRLTERFAGTLFPTPPHRDRALPFVARSSRTPSLPPPPTSMPFRHPPAGKRRRGRPNPRALTTKTCPQPCRGPLLPGPSKSASRYHRSPRMTTTYRILHLREPPEAWSMERGAWGTTSVRAAGATHFVVPTSASTRSTSPVLDERLVEISRGFEVL